MANQFDPMPGVGEAPFAERPANPRGLYKTFGFPERPIRIHFPDQDPNQNPQTSNPWYWYVKRIQPNNFAFLAAPTWGPGFVRRPIYPIIKILPIDTQPITPTPFVGFTSVEQAAKTMPGGPEAFGRFDPRDEQLWDLVVKHGQGGDKNDKFPYFEKPRFNEFKGQIRALSSKQNVNAQVKAVVTQFCANFNAMGDAFNAAAASITPDGHFGTPLKPSGSLFNIPLPDGPPGHFDLFIAQLLAFTTGHSPYPPIARYPSILPFTTFFQFLIITTQAQAYNIAFGQLDPKRWNMSVFPPLDSTIIGNGAPSHISGDYGGWGPWPFPLNGVQT